MGAFDRWRALSREQRRLAMHAGIAVGAAVVGLRVFGVDRTLRIVSRPLKGPALRLAPLAQDTAPTVIGDVVAAVDRAGRYVPGGTCLTKSLALAWILRGRGVEAMVRIGVKTAGRFEAHAWVEAKGVAVQDAPPGYAALLTSFPRPPAP
jgi:hypothetical protein